MKKRAYEQRIREVEHSSFTQLVYFATGGMAKIATVFYKRLALCLAVNWDYPCSFIHVLVAVTDLAASIVFLHKQLHESIKITAVECSNNNQAQIHTHISVPY